MILDKIIQIMNKGSFRVFVLILSLLLASCIMWAPSRFAANTSQLMIWHGLLLIWATCTGVVFGIGFMLTGWGRWIFHPLPATAVLIWGLIHFFQPSFLSNWSS